MQIRNRCRKRININITYSLILEPLHLSINLCHIYVGFTMVIYSEFIGISTCAVDMLNALPHDIGDILLIALNSDYDCRFI